MLASFLCELKNVSYCSDKSVAGRGLVSGSLRNTVPKGGWSEAELLWSNRIHSGGHGFPFVIPS